MERSINEKTKIPLTWIFTLIGVAGSGLVFVVTAAMWLSKLEAKADGHEKVIAEMKSRGTHQEDILNSIDRRLSRIEGALKIKD